MRTVRIALIAVSPLFLSLPANAADIARPVYKASPAPVATFSWTGFYIGGNLGYSWGKAETSASIPGFTNIIGSLDVDVPGASFSDSNKLKGIIGGGQLGYNLQTGPWLFGVEADLQASGEKGRATRVTSFDETSDDGVAVTNISGAATTEYDARIRWFGTVRGRLGYAADGLLIYGTGGLAYGRVQVAGINSIDGVVTDCVGIFPCNLTPFGASGNFSRSKVNTGWTLGAGVEGMLANNWSWKIEYLYLDLGSLNVTSTLPAIGTFTAQTDFTDHILRVGLNYRFGWGKGPVMAKY